MKIEKPTGNPINNVDMDQPKILDLIWSVKFLVYVNAKSNLNNETRNWNFFK